ncbi:ABC transporter ATP-binding protein [Parafrankia colletiae]|uniref:ABC transporter ATP-binding protein n=1 Tax=Parafrankia colletiae TaxID=573497 RepID=A0A1S1R3F9_9ACTN|nr:ABC transporter ATP-binding protein [Parafrankia colletiae]MCK9903753.1 ABC transporter ATP-binding protein [Frankia sp. Cpl3]OHV40309.1 ABC transporter ATP-binding protein [Parafrankia colletiae]
MTDSPDGALLAVRGLRVSYRSGGTATDVVHGIDLDVRPGQVVALVGESGSGKSTTAHAVIGLLPAGGRIEGGAVRFAGVDLTALPEAGLRGYRGRDIALVPQDPTVSLNPVQRIGAQVAEVLLIHGLASRRTAPAAAVAALAQAGLPDPALRARQYPHELSGGMRQRALIAIAFAAEPRLLIADEPTSALDVTIQRRILDQMEKMIGEHGTAVLLITHDLAVAADRADEIVVMSGGAVVERGPSRQILRDPSHPYTRRLIADAPSLADVADVAAQAVIARSPTVARSVAATWSVAAESVEPTGASAAAAEAGTPPLLVADGLVKDFPLPRTSGGPRSVRAVDDVSFTVGRGETFALVGESGSGKSTTARLALRLLDPTAGRIHLDGVDVTDLRGAALRRLRRRMQVVYQNPYASLDPRFSVAETIEEPLRLFGVGSRATRRARARELLSQVALAEQLLERRPAELSGGQRQRVAIARALSLHPDLVVCDEPLSALDVTVQAQILDLLAGLQTELGLSYLFITHDLAVVRAIADRIGVMRGGKLVEVATPRELFDNPRHEYTRELLAAIPGRRTGFSRGQGGCQAPRRR